MCVPKENMGSTLSASFSFCVSLVEEDIVTLLRKYLANGEGGRPRGAPRHGGSMVSSDAVSTSLVITRTRPSPARVVIFVWCFCK